MNLTIPVTLALSVLPISELRGAIPYAYLNNIPLWESYLISVFGNLLVIPIGMVFFAIVEKVLYRFSFFKNLFDSKTDKVRKNIARYGYIGLTLFVGIPLPITGVWTGLCGAWFLRLDKKKSSLALAMGVLISGLIVSLVLLTGSGLSSLFTKQF